MTKDNPKRMLFLIKSLHTAIWAFIVFCALYILFAGITDRKGGFITVAIISVLIEGLILLLNKGECPITTWAKKYSPGDNRVNFDIFLPSWITRRHRVTVAVIFISGFVLVIL